MRWPGLARLTCLPQAGMIAASRPIGPFNSFSNEDHWIDDPTTGAIGTALRTSLLNVRLGAGPPACQYGC